MVQLAIDSASDKPGVALAVGGVAGLVLAWTTERNHSVELMPNIERLLGEAERTKADIEAVFIDIGPGGYAALRVGLSIAKALAHGLGVQAVGVGRLELDAYGVERRSGGRRIVAIHRAGRGELAWASYRRQADRWREESAPRVTRQDAALGELRPDDVVTGDAASGLLDEIAAAGATPLAADEHRVVALAALGDARLRAGRIDDPAALVPLYLRTPAIGPQDAAR
jgi:tRNA threonylcarbamoyladenosine biosynthesis protein TsaB